MPHRSHRILVVDDEEMVRLIIVHSLRRKGWTIDQARNGEEGLAQARQASPDAIVCDLNMPGMDGFQLLAEVRRDPALQHIPFIVITGLTEPGHEQRALQGGAAAFLRKPFDNSTLVGLVEHHLQRAHPELPTPRKDL